jgi:hypothetical protein
VLAVFLSLLVMSGLRQIAFPALVVAMAALVLINGLSLLVRYRRDLRSPEAVPRTPYRIAGDREVAAIFVTATLAPALAAAFRPRAQTS